MTQMTGKITLLLIFILCVYGAKAQVADTTLQYDIFYSSPKTYELAGVRAVGGGENYDEDYLAQMAGLSIGMAVQIPEVKSKDADRKVSERKGIL